MVAKLINGEHYASQWRQELLSDFSGVVSRRLAIVMVGDDQRSQVYVSHKRRFLQESGVETELLHLPSTTDFSLLIESIQRLNDDDAVGGILVQLPLPPHCQVSQVMEAIDPQKDVDGLTPYQQGLLALSDQRAVIPATPRGVLKLLDYESVDLAGKRVVIVNDSALVGRPLAMSLLALGATVMVCNRWTVDLKMMVSLADVVVVAIGKRGVIQPDWFKSDAVVLDVGISMVDGRVKGDVDHDAALSHCQAITPVPGGVGPMTIAALLANMIQLSLGASD